MLKPNGAAELTAFTEKSYKETITPIVPGIWHVLGVGHSNAVIIEGRTSVILVDTLDTLERGQKLLEIIRSRTEKPVKTILYTHGHPDHRGGAGAFSGTDPEIIAFAPATPVLKKTETLGQKKEKAEKCLIKLSNFHVTILLFLNLDLMELIIWKKNLLQLQIRFLLGN
mgnify:CR=1 FL=1